MTPTRRPVRRRLVPIALAALIATPAALGPGARADASDPPVDEDPRAAAPARLRPLDFTPFADALDALAPERLAMLERIVSDSDIARLRARLSAGELSARELVLAYLARIRRLDGALGAVLELNADALADAGRLDAERASGRGEGLLHGIPILLKDNVATGDGLHNTAGALALADHVPSRDAFVVARLREAGALILGKTNPSEWAYFMSSDAPSGYSALGGQTTNPFGAELDVLGSSTGSAVAVVARLAAASIGTETTGSIVAPAAANGAAGVRPTLGLVSADLIVPVARALDGAGPIARGVTDLATLLTVMGARDDDDPNAALADGLHGTDFTVGLERRTLKGLRVGLPTFTVPPEGDPARAVLERTIGTLVTNGAIVTPVDIDTRRLIALARGQPVLLAGGMRDDVAAYLAAAGSTGSIDSLDGVVAFNDEDPARRAPFGQDLLVRALDAAMPPERHAALAARLRDTALEAMARHARERRGPDGSDAVDVLVTLDNTFSLVYALGGTPAVTVPTGLDANGQPHGATFVGLRPGDDALVLGVARAFERAGGPREAPPRVP